jgi:cytoskeletal protein RodZ
VGRFAAKAARRKRVESLGDKLKSTREGKGYNYDQVSRDTNIAVRYLEALEMEDFAQFPGEPYLLGFLRNYGDYLGLDNQELLSMYRALKIQEQPVPVEQLLRGPSHFPRVIITILIVLVVLGAAGGGVYFFLSLPRHETSATVEARPASTYTLEGPALERRFYQGDALLVPLEDTPYKIELTGLGEAVTLTTPSGTVILDLSQEVSIDLNRDGLNDLRITVTDFVKNEPATGTLLRFDLVDDLGIPVESIGVAGAAGIEGADQSVASVTAPAAATAPVFFTSPNAFPFTLQAVFQGYCMFRWEILAERDRRGRNEQYFQRADELNIQAQNGIRLWVSNATAVKLQVIGGGRTVAVDLGSAGEVVVADIRWARDDDGRYRLVLTRLE